MPTKTAYRLYDRLIHFGNKFQKTEGTEGYWGFQEFYKRLYMEKILLELAEKSTERQQVNEATEGQNSQQGHGQRLHPCSRKFPKIFGHAFKTRKGKRIFYSVHPLGFEKVPGRCFFNCRNGPIEGKIGEMRSGMRRL